MSLEKLGWTKDFENVFEPYKNKGYHAARVVTQHKGNYRVSNDQTILNAKLSGKLIHEASVKKDYPTVGDWVVIKIIGEEDSIIQALLPRKNYFARKQVISGGRKMKNGVLVGGNIEEQIIGSNIDTVFIVTGLDQNFNINRLERYITLVLNSKALPVIFLNKCDLCDHIEEIIESIHSITKDIDIYSISAQNDINMNIFEKYMTSGKTMIFIGSSGAGKSTIINHLFGEEIQKTNTVSHSSGKGQHTTTSARLIVHPKGAVLIDTPGLKELQLWGDEDILEESFQEITSLIKKCKYNDCHHDKEDGCAIKHALHNGSLSLKRYESYLSQLRELKTLKENRKSYDHKRMNKKTKQYSDDESID